MLLSTSFNYMTIHCCRCYSNVYKIPCLNLNKFNRYSSTTFLCPPIHFPGGPKRIVYLIITVTACSANTPTLFRQEADVEMIWICSGHKPNLLWGSNVYYTPDENFIFIYLASGVEMVLTLCNVGTLFEQNIIKRYVGK